ncbi:MAG: GNAT family N-acetyltransferase [Clostridia bacterium]|nr:GNAT family N-acetyltransferase [Clostridia bacterium]
MELQTVSHYDKIECDRIRRLYHEAFPIEERAPFALLMKRVRQERAVMYSLHHHGQWCGMIYLIMGKDMVYIFYLAIDQSQRGRGLGKLAMKALLDRYPQHRVFLALEDWHDTAADNREQRLKRHEFYRQCGLSDLPYHIKEGNVIYSIMGTNGKIEPPEYKMLMNRYAGFFMRLIVDFRMIP